MAEIKLAAEDAIEEANKLKPAELSHGGLDGISRPKNRLDTLSDPHRGVSYTAFSCAPRLVHRAKYDLVCGPPSQSLV